MRTRPPRRWAAAAAAVAALAAVPAGTAAADGPGHGGGTAHGQDADFLKAAHQDHLAEIAAGRDAQRNATDPCVKEVGAALVSDHERLKAQGAAQADRLGVDLPAAPTAEQQQRLAILRAEAGTREYDVSWLEAQSAAHQKTLDLIDEEIASGHDPEVEAAAQAARSVVAMHLEMVIGGNCRTPAEVGYIPAGHGTDRRGEEAGGTHPHRLVGAVAAGGGALLALSGAVWNARRRRAAADR